MLKNAHVKPADVSSNTVPARVATAGPADDPSVLNFESLV